MSRRPERTSFRWSANAALLLLVIMVAVTVLVSPLRRRTLVALWPLALGIVLYLVISKVPLAMARLDWLGWALVLFGAFLCILGPLGMEAVQGQPFQRLPLWPRLQARFPDTFNPNVIAGTLVLLVPFGLSKSLVVGPSRTITRWTQRALAAGMTVAMLAILFLSRSRGSSLSVACSVGLMFSLWRPRLARWVVPPVLILAAILGSVLGWRTVVDS